MSQLPPGPDDLFEEELQGGAQPNPLLIVHRALRGRYVLASVLGLALAIPFAIVGYIAIPPEYTSRALLEANVSVPAVLYDEETSDILPAFEAFVGQQAATIMSERVLRRALDDPDLQAVAWPTGDAGLIRLQRSLSVEAPPRKNLIVVAVSDPSPTRAREAASAVLDAYSAIRDEQERLAYGDRIEQLERLRIQYKRDRDTARRNALERSLDTAGTEDLRQAQRIALDELSRIEDQIRELETMRVISGSPTKGPEGEPDGSAEDTTTDGSVRAESAPSPPAASDEDLLAGVQDTKLQELIDERDYMRRQLDSLLMNATPQHRQARQFTRQIKVLEAEIDARKEEILASLRGETETTPSGLRLTELDARLADLKMKRQETKDLLERLARVRFEIVAFEQEAELAESRLDDAERRLEALRVEKNSRITGRIQLSQEPEQPLRPSTDRRKPLAGAGFVGGFGLGFVIIAAYGFAFPRVRVADDVAATGGDFAMLGMIPEFPDNDDEVDGMTVREAFQFLRVLLDARAGRRSLICGVTSPTAGDGKTTIALRLAQSFAATKRRVLLIDADLVGRGATRDLGIRPRERAADEPVTLRGSVVHLDELGFDFIPSSEEEWASEVFCGRILGDMVEEMRSEYDVVLVDTGPILGSIEAAAMTPIVDQVMLVVSRGLESRLLKMAVDRLRELNARRVGLVFNRATTVDFKRSFAPPSSTSRRSVNRGLTSATPADARRVMTGENGAADR